jgi:hypothetical protein
MAAGCLGRRAPTSWEHVDRYPLSALSAAETPTCVPVTIGINWYSNFDNPVGDGTRWWIGRDHKNLGSIRGGHCVCIRPSSVVDSIAWWDFYDQGAEGACAGFGSSRMMTLLNRKRYTARWLWDWAKAVDEWADTNPGDDNGTSVKAAMDVLRLRGHVPWQASYADMDYKQRDALAPHAADGISANRWATTVDQIRPVLASPLQEKLGGVQILNSWGRSVFRTTSGCRTRRSSA